MALLLLLAAVTPLFAQYDPGKVCRMDNGRLIFMLDTRWTDAQKKEIGSFYDLDSALLADAFAAKPIIKEKGNTWTTRKVDKYRIELVKPIGQTGEEDAGRDKILLLDDQWINLPALTDRGSVPYGVNRMTRNTITKLSGEKVRFFLPGFRNARDVYIAGSFNGWSTLQTPLEDVDSGWTVTLDLKPGKYTYKYIVDGKWTNDPFNRQLEDDSRGGINSVWFVYDFRFVLNGYANAKSVYVAGSFNQWRQDELKMIRYGGKWIIHLFLREGTHAYKFIVDGQWINDPANKITRPDGKGNINSFVSLGDTLTFYLKGYPEAKKVILSGDFNAWNQGELFMERSGDGWKLPYVLAAGNYEYKYIVDGKWIVDPGNPFTTGEGDYTNSFLAVKSNHSFVLEGYPDAKRVVLSGSFNGWSLNGYRMQKWGGRWVIPVYLNPGKYIYKYIVDGKWILDPSNDLWEENEYGTNNSVLWINP
jgi:1,4-alpha-glucan branching enzyme